MSWCSWVGWRRVLKAARWGFDMAVAVFDAKAAGQRLSGLAELATVFPVQSIDPEVHRLIEEGPQERRRFLDWGGVPRGTHGFVDQVASLPARIEAAERARFGRRQMDDVVRAWDGELIEAGEALASLRRRYLRHVGTVRGRGRSAIGWRCRHLWVAW
jgi:DNA replication and repair protein RecF